MDVVVGLIGGLGFFLFGMSYMNDALQNAAGKKMKHILSELTKNKLTSVIVGTVVTGIIQSSSAVTVMVVSFVNAGLMNLNQAVGIIMGANIGTTVTALLISFDIAKITTLLGAIGVFIYLVSKNNKIKYFAQVVIGFGILFVGMNIMEGAMVPLKDNAQFTRLIIGFDNPYLGILAGFAMTAVLQSSSATTGLLIATAATGAISFSQAYPIVFGQNIGTCVTAMLASIGTNVTAKRAAFIHLLFNIIGTILFVLILRIPTEMLILKIASFNVPRQIALGNIIFNVVSVIVLYPFSDLLVKASIIFVKVKQRKNHKYV